ncbi:putative phage abortive infection protein [Robertkochia aurantiaca]|uniref:putative phage abortive infection protein n=1 Tax=Robertkochia aurantiaca TaxID=2873700 RepID=UPI001CCA45AE|nr:putative phage abortive infection protein [Robertkochia sp. 3YJGBD-33]
MNIKEIETKKDLGIYFIGILAVLLILGLWLYTYYELKDMPANERGTLGDMFGTVNALFSGLAFAGIILTILLQKKELGYQRKELQETRAEFIIQNKTLKTQRFENTFFNLLELHNQIVNDIDYEKKLIPADPFTDKTRTVKGRDVFQDKFNNLNREIKEDIDANKLYLRFYEKSKTDFGHYFRNLYRIFKMIHETEFVSSTELNLDLTIPENKEKYDLCNYIQRYRYTSIVRAQLSDYELLLLFYNCLSDNGKDKFKPLVEEYAILKNMPTNDIKQKKLLDIFEPSAYKNKNEGKI